MKIRQLILLLILSLKIGSLCAQCPESVERLEYCSNQPKWRLNISGGMGYMLASTKESKKQMIGLGIDKKKAEDYMKNMKRGMQANTDLHYLINSKLGIGLKYIFFHSSTNIDNITIKNYTGDNIHNLYGDISGDYYINFWGPSLLGIHSLNESNTLKATSLFSLGLTHYREETKTIIFPMLATGYSFGSYFELGIEYSFAKNISAGINIDLLTSSLGKLKYNDGVNSVTTDLGDNRQNVTRFGISLGIRIYR